MQYTGKNYKNETVRIDNTVFIDCTFDECELIYGGSGMVVLRDCDIKPTCQFRFDGPAGNTIAFLTAMYKQMRPLVEATFDNIRRGERPSG